MKSIINILTIALMWLGLMFFNVNSSQAQDYYEIKVKSGDGILSLLRKYKLLDYSCNYYKFLEMNNLKSESNLIIGKKYKLPLFEYEYNGSSIRTTLNIKDMDQAVKIRDYNYDLVQKGVIGSKFEKSKKLLVPYSELKCQKDNKDEVKTEVNKNDNDKGKETVSKDKNNEKIEEKIDSGLSKTSKKRKDTISSIQLFKSPKAGQMNRYVPLFGDKWATVPIEDYRLENRVFYVLTGHGGPDPGAICTDSEPMLCEDEYAYDVSLRLARDLMQHGATVHVIVQDKNDGIRDDRYLPCDSDEVTIDGLKIPISQKKRLRQRTQDVNNLYSFYKKKNYIKSQTLIEVHVDSRHEDDRIDVFFSYPKGSKSSEKLANNMQKTFEKKYMQHQSDRGYSGTSGQQNFYVINNALPTAILVELANIKNSKDHERLLNPFNRQALANWMFEAIIDTYY